MADIMISELPATTEASDSSYIPIDNGNLTKKITIGDFNSNANRTAKHYAEQAQTYASNAAASATSAQTYANNASTSANSAQTSANNANTAKTSAQTYAGNASVSADSAANSAASATAQAQMVNEYLTQAEDAASDSEAWATGERDGSAVDPEDETYHNNSKYYAEIAETNATGATQSASAASSSATSAANSATSAAASASTAESWSAHPPYIGANGDWYVWDIQTSAFVDSGIDASATVDIGDITMLAPDATPYVTKTGTDAEPVFHLFIPRGYKGDPGVSPIVTVTTITGGHRVTIVDEAHPTGQSFDVMDATGDMEASVYDPNGTVANAGGIVDYVATKMDKTNPSGTGSFSLNRKANTTVGSYSFAEGETTTASGEAAHAEGFSTIASEYFSHAEGFQTTASGEAAHAEGDATTASGAYSHAEGTVTTASGLYSHAEGRGTLATKQAAHAEGHQTTASGEASHAEGFNTIAGYNFQHVGGKFNSNKSTTLFEVGNGTLNSARSNAFEVYSDGSLSTDNGTTKVKLETVYKSTDTTETSIDNADYIPFYDTSAQAMKKIARSNFGDMRAAVYDPNGTVAAAGGIEDFIKDNAPRYNVLDYGLKGDGTTDNSSAFEDMLDELPNSSVIYFPAGTYVFNSPITISKNGVSLIGETRAYRTVLPDSPSKPQSKLLYTGGANTTFITRGTTCYNFIINGITFESDSYRFVENTDAFSGIPYPYFKENIIKDNVNGVDLMSGGITISVEHCVFTGFSGYGLAVHTHVFIKNCTFAHCGKGFMSDSYDLWVQNSWFNHCGKAIYRPATQTNNFCSISVTDTWVDVCTNAIVLESNSNTILADGIWFDMLDEAAIVSAGDLANSRISGRISRAGMKYAGITDGNRTSALGAKTDSIHCKRIYNSKIDVCTQKREIGTGNNSHGICPSRIISTDDQIIITCDIFDVTATFADMYDPNNDIATETVFHASDREVEQANVQTYDYGKVHFRNNSPVGAVRPRREYYFALDKSTDTLYRSTGTSTKNDWAAITISPKALKAIVSQCNDFTDFKTLVEQL